MKEQKRGMANMDYSSKEYGKVEVRYQVKQRKSRGDFGEVLFRQSHLEVEEVETNLMEKSTKQKEQMMIQGPRGRVKWWNPELRVHAEWCWAITYSGTEATNVVEGVC